MRKIMVAFVVTSALASKEASAAPWTVPTNVRVVQKSNTDNNGRIYGTIQQAINSITDSSATNPYVVKIMPGVYSECVTMKPFVSLVGSGQESTQIVSVGCTAVTGANGAEIRDFSIVGSPGQSAIYNLDAAPKIRNVTIMVNGSSVPGYSSCGIYNYAHSLGVEDVIVENVRIAIVSGGGGAEGVRSMGEWNGSGYNTVTTIVRGSTISITADNVDGVGAVGVSGGNYSPVIVDGSDITVEVRSGNTGVAAGASLQLGAVSNSKLTVRWASPNAAGVRVTGGWDVTTRIHNTPIDASTPVVKMSVSNIRCANVYDVNLSPVVCP